MAVVHKSGASKGVGRTHSKPAPTPTGAGHGQVKRPQKRSTATKGRAKGAKKDTGQSGSPRGQRTGTAHGGPLEHVAGDAQEVAKGFVKPYADAANQTADGIRKEGVGYFGHYAADAGKHAKET